MAIHTIRPGFTITLGLVTYVGGEEVDLTAEEFELHKHKLEGVESSIIPIDFGISSNGDFPAPHFRSISPNKIIVGESVTLKISGSFFTPDITFMATGSTVNQVNFVSDNLIEADVTAGETLGSFPLTINNGKSTEVANAIIIDQPIIWDFREEFNQAIEKGSRTNLVNNPYWLQVTCNGTSWQGSIRFLGDDNKFVWSRDQKQTLSWILFPAGMVGVGSNDTDFNSTQQYYQGELKGYFNNANTFYGFYGNSGTPGSGTNQYVNQPLDGADIVKLTLTNNGEPGGEYRIYDMTPDDSGWQQSGLTREQYLSRQLTTADWFKTDNLIKAGEIASNMSADEPIIMPFVALSTSITLRLLGFYLE